MSFRVTELQMLLTFAGKNRNGKKNELQTRALELLKRGQLTVSIQNKIQELYKARYTGTVSSSLDLSTTDHVDHRTRYADNTSIGQTTTNTSMKPLGNSMLQRGYASASASHVQSDYYSSMPRVLDYVSSPSMSAIPSNKMYSHPQMQYPVLADVKFKPLPFFDVYGELLKPATLIPTATSRFQESNYNFHLTTSQANEIAMSLAQKPDGKPEHVVQIQMRFCLMETSCEQEDNFPPSICVKVNSKMCSLPNPLPTNKPGMEPKRPSRPVNITHLCRISPTTGNQISVSWASEYGRAYAVGVFLVKKQSAEQLLQRIKSKGLRNSEYTRAMIKEKLAQDPDSEIATMSLRGSLLCPLGKMRIQIPCRATTCAHIQCFDSLLYLQMNEKKPGWICPVCDKKAEYQNLTIDGLFTEIINQAPSNCSEVQFHEDGSWEPVIPIKKEPNDTVNVSSGKRNARKSSKDGSEPKKKKVEIDIITIDSDSDTDTEEVAASSSLRTPVVLSSGSSSGSDTPNLALPSPDSSSVSSSSLSANNQHLNPLLNKNTAFSSKTLNSRPPDLISSLSSECSGMLSNMPWNTTSSSSYSTMPLLTPSTNTTFYPTSNSFSYSNEYSLSTSHLFNQRLPTSLGFPIVNFFKSMRICR
ncbi:E3 SUMO-protein ligase PIAS2-like protein [Leptotrombidium deliense]|uniref:E3 SUMO-protein ligase PIAS2-like protein n=1 Tax=Leptotrombidium deliense TaxID=299467 RepID=A0A443S674_9ACAR|nr:E3 SUMO-protein ligase PIAS2-like protein [Leptotrombidium deliense]